MLIDNFEIPSSTKSNKSNKSNAIEMVSKTNEERLGVWAVALEPDGNIDRRGAKRTVPMQVLSLGLSRTGTASMQEAYKILGYENPYHFANIFANVKDADMWSEAMQAKMNKTKPYGRAEYDQLLGHCAAVTDSPGCCMWEELVEAYPEAKVVLVERDEAKWVKSFGVLLEGVLNPFGRYVLQYTDPWWFGRVLKVSSLWIGTLCGSTDVPTIKKNAADIYRRHYRDVRAKVPKDNLLNYQLGSGWEPLCQFLGKEVPDVPFPHRNEADILENAMGTVMMKSVKRSLRNVVVVGVAAFAIWRYFL